MENMTGFNSAVSAVFFMYNADSNSEFARILVMDGVESAKKFITNGGKANFWDRGESRPLLTTLLKMGKFEEAQYLLDLGADIHKLNTLTESVLINCLHHCTPEILTFLLKNGANPNDQNMYGESALRIILDYESKGADSEEAKLLKSYGAIATEPLPW